MNKQSSLIKSSIVALKTNLLAQTVCIIPCFLYFSLLKQSNIKMAYNQQQQAPQQYVVTGQMLDMGSQQILQQPQYVTVNQPAMTAATIGK